jgi:ADP-heptose:LPS heptosyltransferase
MISFFTSFKPFRGTTGVQQRNAVRSWRAAVPGCEIIVCGAVEGDADVLAEVNAVRVPDIACNAFGTPLISALFAEAQRLGSHRVLCYINGDIILLPDFAGAVARLSSWRTFAAVGQRWDLDWDAPIDVGRAGWEETLRQAVGTRGQQHDGRAMDFFAFRRGAVGPLPEFAIGRPAWDNYLIKHFLVRHIPIVDLSRVTMPIHQNHDYAHVAQRKGAAWDGPEAERNRALAAEQFWGFNPRYYSIMNAQWIMFDRRIVPAVGPRRAWWRFMPIIPDPIRNAARIGLYLMQHGGPMLRRFADLFYSLLRFRFLPRDPRAVAVVRVDNIGDFILWLDGARAIRERYPRPDYHLVLIASLGSSAFAESSGLFDHVIAVDPKRFFRESRYRRGIFREVARFRFATAINPTFSRSAFIDDFLVRATGASVCIGQVGDLSNSLPHMKRITDRWYTRLLPPAEHATHELEKNWQFARQFDARTELRVPPLEPTMLSRPSWLVAGTRYFVLFPGAAAPIKQWPIERFGEIASRIHAKTGWSGIVCGLTSDAASAKQLIVQANGVPIRDACGQTTLQELAAVIAESQLTVTNDTSAGHLAASLRRPAAVILGGGHFGRFLPFPQMCGADSQTVQSAYRSMPCYQCNWHCIHPRRFHDPAPCISAVTVDDVWAMVEPMLGLRLASAH